MRNTTYRSRFILFVCISLFSANSFGQIVWQKTIGYGNDTAETARDVYVNPDGSLIVAGKSNMGLVIKLDTAGRTVWKTYLTNSWDIQTIIPFDDTSYLCVGSGTSVDTTTGNHWGTTDVFLARLNWNGTVLWKKYYGGSKGDNGVDVVKTNDGGFAVLGTTMSVDGQVTGADSLSYVESNAWVFKINASGNLLWQKSLDYLDSTFSDRGLSILTANNQQLLVYTTTAAYNMDQNSGAVSYFNYSYNSMPGKIAPAYASVCKTENGDAYLFGYPATYQPDSGPSQSFICVKKITIDGTLLSVDTIRNTLDMPAATGSHGLIALPGNGYFSAGYVDVPTLSGGPLGEYTNGCIYNSYTRQLLNFGSQYNDDIAAVKLLPGGEGLIAVGTTNGYSDDLMTSVYTSDMWVVKINFNNTIRGNVFVDANNNNVQDAGENGLKNAKLNTSSINDQVTTQPYSVKGDYSLNTGKGAFTTKVQLPRPYYTAVPDSVNTTFTGNNQVAVVNFALHPISGIKDYAVNVSASARVRPGFDHDYYITCSNNGTDTFTIRDLLFIKDHRFNFISAVPAPASVSGDSITWHILNVPPTTSKAVSLTLTAATIPQVNIGDTLRSSVYLDSTGDAMTADNLIQISELVSGSYDPNDKQENYAGNMPLKDIVEGKNLDYLVRFQNTGNDTAFTIVVRDTLDAQLDASSFVMLDASHPYVLSIKDGKYIAWTFKGIKLLDSLHNEALSHGYISYRIKPALPIGIGDVISNRAAIYFDFNPAVLTNNQQTKVGGPAIPYTWTGAVSVNWENPLNWNANKVPDINTAVIIPGMVANFPEINSNAACYSIHIDPSATVLVKAGFRLLLTGKRN